MNRQRDGCPRTPGLIDRVVAGAVNLDDRRHAETCPSCAPVLARAARFDHELERSAQRLIAEDLPIGVLDPELAGHVISGPNARRLSPGVTAGFAAVAVLVLATVVGVRPVLLPGASPTQPTLGQVIEAPGPPTAPGTPLWSLGELTVALAEGFGYECGREAVPTPGAGSADGASASCTTPPDAGPFTATVVLHATEAGAVGQVTITAQIDRSLPVGSPAYDRARDAIATALAKVTAQAFTGRGAGIRAANFVFVKASSLSGPAWAMGIDESGVHLALERRADGGYIVHMSVT